ncbi:hypothetical protein N9M50_07135 [Alphaproteobacteria bacterium]|nr:hypothetical protein [Alphaproteobacteria bacterium]
MDIMRILMASKAETGVGDRAPSTDAPINIFPKTHSPGSLDYFRPTDFLSAQEWLSVFKA